MAVFDGIADASPSPIDRHRQSRCRALDSAPHRSRLERSDHSRALEGPRHEPTAPGARQRPGGQSPPKPPWRSGGADAGWSLTIARVLCVGPQLGSQAKTQPNLQGVALNEIARMAALAAIGRLGYQLAASHTGKDEAKRSCCWGGGGWATCTKCSRASTLERPSRALLAWGKLWGQLFPQRGWLPWSLECSWPDRSRCDHHAVSPRHRGQLSRQRPQTLQADEEMRRLMQIPCPRKCLQTGRPSRSKGPTVIPPRRQEGPPLSRCPRQRFTGSPNSRLKLDRPPGGCGCGNR
jgi:hypothetical protein